MSSRRVPTVLIVDDVPPVLSVLTSMVAFHGCGTISAGTGRRAIEVYQARREEIAAVVLGVQMRDMDGSTTLAALREVTPDLPCIFVNGGAADYTTADLHAFGCVAVLNKPKVLDDLKGALITALCRHSLGPGIRIPEALASH